MNIPPRILNIPNLHGGVISYLPDVGIVPEHSPLLSLILTALTSRLVMKTVSGCCRRDMTGPLTLFPVCGGGGVTWGLGTQLGTEVLSPGTLLWLPATKPHSSPKQLTLLTWNVIRKKVKCNVGQTPYSFALCLNFQPPSSCQDVIKSFYTAVGFSLVPS